MSAFVCCFSLCDEFEKIAEKALSTPPNTAELMEIKVLSTKSLSLYLYKLIFSFFSAAVIIIDMIIQYQIPPKVKAET